MTHTTQGPITREEIERRGFEMSMDVYRAISDFMNPTGIKCKVGSYFYEDHDPEDYLAMDFAKGNHGYIRIMSIKWKMKDVYISELPLAKPTYDIEYKEYISFGYPEKIVQQMHADIRAGIALSSTGMRSVRDE